MSERGRRTLNPPYSTADCDDRIECPPERGEPASHEPLPSYPTGNKLFDHRVRQAMNMLEGGESRLDVAEIHGSIVLGVALRERRKSIQ